MPTETEEEALTNVKGIGPVTADKLKEAGILTLTQLAISRPEEIAAILEITGAKARELAILAKSKALDRAIELKTGKQISDWRKANVKYISTGSREVDRILGGGVPTDNITLFSGQSAAGKTQTCLALAVNCVKQLGRPVAFIETEPSSFNPDRLMQIANIQKVPFDLDKDIYAVTSDFVTDPYKQMLAYEIVEKKIKSGVNIGLIIIDSFNAKFRQTYLGREVLTDRSKETARHMNFLETLASKYNIAIVLTGQVMGVPDSGAQLGAMMRFKMKTVVYGGEFFLHSIGNHITLQQKEGKDGGLWQATLVDSSSLPIAAAQFKITAGGIEDTVPQSMKK